MLTGIRSEAEVASPVTRVNENNKRVDVGSTHSTSHYCGGVYHWTLLSIAKQYDVWIKSELTQHCATCCASQYALKKQSNTSA